MTPELLPCPHCGNAYPAVGYDSDMRALGRELCITARCRQCGAETRKCDNAKEAAELWNRRAPLSPAVLAELPEVRALVAAETERCAKAASDAVEAVCLRDPMPSVGRVLERIAAAIREART